MKKTEKNQEKIISKKEIKKRKIIKKEWKILKKREIP
jgi:hypothetical protein